MWLVIGTGRWQVLVNSNETSGSINCGELLDWLRNCELLKQD
jgi:hypothetical protein